MDVPIAGLYVPSRPFPVFCCGGRFICRTFPFHRCAFFSFKEKQSQNCEVEEANILFRFVVRDLRLDDAYFTYFFPCGTLVDVPFVPLLRSLGERLGIGGRGLFCTTVGL